MDKLEKLEEFVKEKLDKEYKMMKNFEELAKNNKLLEGRYFDKLIVREQLGIVSALTLVWLEIKDIRRE